MIGAVPTWVAVLWWVVLAAIFLVYVPAVVLIANRIVQALRVIRDYAADILEHGVGVARNLDPVPELGTTRDLVKRVGSGMERYAAALDRIVTGGSP